MSKISRATGFRDLLSEDAALHRHIRDICFSVAKTYNFEEINLPLMEKIHLFARGLGETSDVVSKEMFLLHNRTGEPKYALRPEGTAGTVRAFIENSLQHSTPLKLYYEGPMFRYERPQKGRYRQFWQAGVEFIGASHPSTDVEVIALGFDILKKLGVSDKVQLQINTLGDVESRLAYKEALISYLSPYEKELSEISQERLHKNPMRILDSKDEADQKIVKEAPKMGDYLTDQAKEWFDHVCQNLQNLNIPFTHNSLLVRGLDYYVHTAFEFISFDDEIGSQAAVLAGGRYDGLIQQLGGAPTPAVGWAAGIDRLSLITKQRKEKPCFSALMPMGERAEQEAHRLAQQLRDQGFVIDLYYGGNLTKRLKKATKFGAKIALILGDEELDKKEIMVKNLQESSQHQFSINQLITYLDEHQTKETL